MAETQDLGSALDLDTITVHLLQIVHCRFFDHQATLAHHRVAIDQCVDRTKLPYEIKQSLKTFYMTERLSEWLFYVSHIEMLLKQYGVNIFYWSSTDSIQTYKDMYLYHDLGLYDDQDETSVEEEEEEEGDPSVSSPCQVTIPDIVVTQYY